MTVDLQKGHKVRLVMEKKDGVIAKVLPDDFYKVQVGSSTLEVHRANLILLVKKRKKRR